MYLNERYRRQRELVVTFALSLLAASAVFFFFMLVSGGLVLAILAALAAMFIVGYLHYTLWGREMAQEVRRRNEVPPSPQPPRRF
jgi:hypothetical protein